MKSHATIVVESRVDSRDLAGIAKFFIENNVIVPSMSYLLSLTVKSYYEALLSQELTTPVETVDEARVILKSLNIIKKKSKLAKSLASAIMKESLVLENEALGEVTDKRLSKAMEAEDNSDELDKLSRELGDE